ncbi:MraY family glycosyltransferase [Devosia alba]|uniref:MraY family glycosyltransferase n=1 Tax=Devosia alba TaxID=3152360 RepID=UPI0032660505
MIALLLGSAITRLLIAWAPRLGLVQAPNERSSHIVPTPTGGGAAVAVSVVGCALALVLLGQFPLRAALWLALGSVIAGLGIADDVWDLSPAIRLIMQIVVVSATVALAWPLPELQFWFYQLSAAALGVFLVVACLWWINLFNFMDGIDGLAGSQAILILAGALGLWFSAEGGVIGQPVWLLGVATVGASTGFLLSNWPPARIFMGDAGSNFLAFVILVVMLTLVGRGILGYGAVLAMAAVFISDATVTLVRRAARGERPWAAHRQHAYQRLSRRFGHRPVAIVYGVATLLWALPLAVLAVQLPDFEWILAAAAVLPLAIAVLAAGAGAREEMSAARPTL